MSFEVKTPCLLFNIMYKAGSLKKNQFYDVIDKVCISIGQQFPNSYCNIWGDSIPYMLKCLSSVIKEEKDKFVYVNKKEYNEKYIENNIMLLYPKDFKKALPDIIDKELCLIQDR